MVERFNVISISLFKCACCHAYVVFCAICVACSDCGFVNYVFSHAFSWSGHVFLSLQVHGSMTSHCGLLFPVMRVLCLEMIDLTLFMQL